MYINNKWGGGAAFFLVALPRVCFAYPDVIRFSLPFSHVINLIFLVGSPPQEGKHLDSRRTDSSGPSNVNVCSARPIPQMITKKKKKKKAERKKCVQLINDDEGGHCCCKSRGEWKTMTGDRWCVSAR